jgi:iduronate 2-sulfatase
MNRRQFLGVSLAASVASAATPRYNVLLIIVSDLRPDLGCYGHPVVHSPNIDALAARGTLFNRVYCQFANASPSRTSFLTGRRPETTRIYDTQTHFRRHLPDVVTLPQLFKQAGYVSTGFGRIYQQGLNDVDSWSIPAWFPPPPGQPGLAWNTPENAKAARKWREGLEARGWKNSLVVRTREERGPSWEAREGPDDTFPDGQTAKAAVEAMQTLKDQSFFMAVGFQKPHLPLIVPKRYFDIYAKKKVVPVDYPSPPSKVPPVALHNNPVLRSYEDIPQAGPITETKTLELIRAYYAGVSFADAQVGKLLRGLDRAGVRDNTVVVLCSDNGWQFGNHGLWHKHSNFERAVRTALIVSSPGQKQRGVRADGLTELVDIYPTVGQLAGLTVPKDLEGRSFATMLDDPKARIKTAAFSQFPRNVEGVGTVMGYTIRTERYRYTVWRAMDAIKNFRAYELYDYITDPLETANVADHADYAKIRKELQTRINAGWRAA